MEFSNFRSLPLEQLSAILTPQSKITYLAGAGISMNAPSNLPSARAIVRGIIELCCPAEEVDSILSLEKLRYELVVDKIEAQDVDGPLNLMDYFEVPTTPNLIHIFLALTACKKSNPAYLLTTNFDYLIELACQSILKTNSNIINISSISSIVPVITKQDFVEFSDPQKLSASNKVGIYKLHGSKRNIITKKLTSESMITTISALGRDREEGQTFAIEPYKKPAVYNLFSKRILVVMGYSGSDDFDITPVLREIPEIAAVIWINHQLNASPASYKVTPDSSQVPSSSQSSSASLSGSDALLVELASRRGTAVYRLDGDTNEIIRNYLWKLSIPEVPIPSISAPPIFNASQSAIPDFKIWYAARLGTVDALKSLQFTYVLYQALGQPKSALRMVLKGIELATLQNNRDALVNFLNWAGMCYEKLTEWQQATEHYEKALAMLEQSSSNKSDRKFKDLKHTMRQSILNNLALVYHNKGEYEKAIELYKKAYDFAEKNKDSATMGSLANNMARIYDNRGEFDKAITLYQSAIKAAEQSGELNLKAGRLNNLGYVYLKMGKVEETEKLYTEALAIAEQLGDLSNIGFFLNNIGKLNLEQKNYLSARDYFERSLQIARQLGDWAQIGLRLNNIGTTIAAINGPDAMNRALAYYEEALDIANTIQDAKGKANRLGNIADILQQQAHQEIELYKVNTSKAKAFQKPLSQDMKGLLTQADAKIQKAIRYLEEGIEIYLQMDLKKELKNYLTLLAQLYEETKQYDKMAEAYRMIIQTAKAEKNLKQASIFMSKLGFRLNKIQRYQESIDVMRECVQIDHELKDWEGKSVDLGYLGTSYMWLKKWEDAVIVLDEAVKYAQQTNQREDQADFLTRLGKCYANLNKIPEAAMVYENAINLYETLGNKTEMVHSLELFGDMYRNVKQWTNAIGVFQRILSIRRQTHDRKDLINALNDLGFAYFDSNNFNEALTTFQESLGLFIHLGLEKTEECNVLKDNIAFIQKKLQK